MTEADDPVLPTMNAPTESFFRRLLPIVVILGVSFVLLLALRPGISAIGNIAPYFHGTTLGWFVAAAICQAVMYLCIAGILRAGLSTANEEAASKVPLLSLAGSSAAFLWANRALPGPAVAGLATLVFLLGRRGVSSAAAQAAAATFYVADYIAFAPLCIGVLFLLSEFGKLAGLHPVVLVIALGVVGAGMIVSVVVLKSPVLLDRVAVGITRAVSLALRRPDPNALSESVRGGLQQFFHRWDEITARPAPLVKSSCWSLLMHMAEVATIFCAVMAFAITLPSESATGSSTDSLGITASAALLGASAAYVAANLAAIVSFLPAGLGFFEGAMVTSLHLIAGMSVPQAALATVLYRLLSVWLPLPFVLRTARHAVAGASATAGGPSGRT